MRHHGFDAANHPFNAKEPDVIQSKKKSKRNTVRAIDKNIIENITKTDNDPNENSFIFSDEEIDH